MRTRVAAATVKFLRQGGQGVLVPGHLIVTAAHVLGWTAEGAMALGDNQEFVELFETVDGRQLRAYPLAVEAVSDIAILGALDEQWSPTDADAFEAFCEATAPVPLAVADHLLGDPFPVQVLAHTGEWLTGRATQWAPEASTLAIEMEKPILGGTSGGPVVTDDGQLLGVVSSYGGAKRDDEDEYQPGHVGSIPCLHLAAPVWLVRRMTLEETP